MTGNPGTRGRWCVRAGLPAALRSTRRHGKAGVRPSSPRGPVRRRQSGSARKFLHFAGVVFGCFSQLSAAQVVKFVQYNRFCYAHGNPLYSKRLPGNGRILVRSFSTSDRLSSMRVRISFSDMPSSWTLLRVSRNRSVVCSMTVELASASSRTSAQAMAAGLWRANQRSKILLARVWLARTSSVSE
jgi:hypothetical protein